MAQQLLDYGPLPTLPPQPPSGLSQEQSLERLKEVHHSLIVQKPRTAEGVNGSENISRPGQLYRRYRNVQELPQNAKTFYEIAGKI